jgi:heme a synthase
MKIIIIQLLTFLIPNRGGLMSQQEQDKKWITFWLIATCFLIWIMIMLGGATRLTHAGLSIVEWKPITGIIPPFNDTQWQEEFGKYQQFPEYQQVNQGMSLIEFKFIFWMEYTHRLLGRLIGLVFFVPLLWFWRRGVLTPYLKKASVLAALLGVGQGVMGWYMVKSGLVKNPAVSHYRLTAHLLLAMAIYAVLFWSILKVNYGPGNGRSSLAGIAHGCCIMVVLTIAYGGFVAGLKAGLIYNTYPLMGGQWIPSEWNFLEPIHLNFFENAATVQWMHRTFAVATLGVLLYGAYKAYLQQFWSFKVAAVAMGAAIFFQVVLGIMTLLAQVPVSLGTLHQGTAVGVLSSVLYFFYVSLYQPLEKYSHAKNH